MLFIRALLGLFCLASTASALLVRSYDMERHARFASGYPDAPLANGSEAFLLAGHDLSGVGWNAANPSQSVALLSPQHFVGANHFRIGIGATVHFLTPEGLLTSETVNAITHIKNGEGENTDLYIGHLLQPVEGATPFAVTNLTELQLVGETAYLYGKTARVGTSTITAFQDFGADPLTSGAGIQETRTFTTSYNSLGGAGDDARLESGDSGSPTFVIQEGQLALAGTHTAILESGNLTTSYDSSVGSYLDQIQATLALDGYSLTVIPEPSTSLLLLSGLLPLLRRRR
ncbi:MAG: hypothetical protein AAF555_06555 [Verrucomicrobiota bacterium]